MSLREDLRQVKAAIISCARTLPSGEAVAFPAFEMTFFRKGTLVGAAIPTGEDLINIHNVHPGKSYTVDGDNALPGVPGNFLTLTVNTDKTNLRDDVMCSEFADRVLSFVKLEDGTRNLLLANPWEWAERIIEMSGDAVSAKMVHPMVAELYLLNGLRDAGLLTDVVNEYRGPTGGTHDFELPGMSLECKSRLHGDRTSRAGELVVSSEHQLSPTGKKPLYVVYCPMEESGNESLERCVEHFGEPRADIMAKLEEAVRNRGGNPDYLKALWAKISTNKLEQMEAISAVMNGAFPEAVGLSENEEIPESVVAKLPTMDDLNALMPHINEFINCINRRDRKGWRPKDLFKKMYPNGLTSMPTLMPGSVQAAKSMKGAEAQLRAMGANVDYSSIDNFTTIGPFGERRVVKVGRNDPCPCGSGLKYKKCHGKGR